MRRVLLAAIVAVVLALAFAAGARASARETVRVVNRSHVPSFVLRRDAPIWQRAANLALAPVWGTPKIRVALGAGASDLTIWLLPGSPKSGALGWHDASGIHLYADAIREQGHGISGATTHELFEALVDPHQNAAVVHDPGEWLEEVCDPAPKSWLLGGIRISDFVTPSWFGLPGPSFYDFAEAISAPFQILPGGSAIVWTSDGFVTIWG